MTTVEDRPVMIAFTDLDSVRDLLTAAMAGRHHAYVDQGRLDKAIWDTQKQLRLLDPSEPGGE